MKRSDFRVSYLIVLVAAVAYAFVTLRGPHGIPAWFEKRHEIESMESRILQITRENEARRERIERLENNPNEQEMEIRKRLKLVKPDEKVYILTR